MALQPSRRSHHGCLWQPAWDGSLRRTFECRRDFRNEARAGRLDIYGRAFFLRRQLLRRIGALCGPLPPIPGRDQVLCGMAPRCCSAPPRRAGWEAAAAMALPMSWETGADGTIRSFTDSLRAHGRGPFSSMRAETSSARRPMAANTDGGLLYKLTANTWNEATLQHFFCVDANCTDGKQPTGKLLMDGAGDLFGTTAIGGSSDDGVVFERPSSGGYHVVYNFLFADGLRRCGAPVPNAGVTIDALRQPVRHSIDRRRKLPEGRRVRTRPGRNGNGAL